MFVHESKEIRIVASKPGYRTAAPCIKRPNINRFIQQFVFIQLIVQKFLDEKMETSHQFVPKVLTDVEMGGYRV